MKNTTTKTGGNFMNKYFLKDGDKLRLYHGGVTCDCYKTSWDYAKENRKQLLEMGYIEVK